MARSIPKQTRTQADDLRDLLESSYKAAVNIKGAGPDQARELLAQLDRIDELFPALATQGVDLRPERGRWQEVQGAVRRHGDALRGELARLGGLKSLRAELPAPPPEERWWWWLDVTAKRQIRHRLLVTAAVIAGILLLMAGGVWTFNKLFPVDPAVSAAYEHKTNAEDRMFDGDLAGAVTELEAALRATPDDLDILATLAALYDLTGQEDKAEPILNKLFEAYPPATVHASIAQNYAIAGAVDKALALANLAIEEDPGNPQGYLVAGQAYEALGQVKSAMEAYQKAAEAASAAGQHQIEALAKIRLATLLQKPQISQTPAATTIQPGG